MSKIRQCRNQLLHRIDLFSVLVAGGRGRGTASLLVWNVAPNMSHLLEKDGFEGISPLNKAIHK